MRARNSGSICTSKRRGPRPGGNWGIVGPTMWPLDGGASFNQGTAGRAKGKMASVQRFGVCWTGKRDRGWGHGVSFPFSQGTVARGSQVSPGAFQGAWRGFLGAIPGRRRPGNGVSGPQFQGKVTLPGDPKKGAKAGFGAQVLAEPAAWVGISPRARGKKGLGARGVKGAGPFREKLRAPRFQNPFQTPRG